MTERGWDRRFADPIRIDAGEHMATLPKKEHAVAEWQAAMDALILVAESGGPTMFARIGIVQALNRLLRGVLDRAELFSMFGERLVAGDRRPFLVCSARTRRKSCKFAKSVLDVRPSAARGAVVQVSS